VLWLEHSRAFKLGFSSVSIQIIGIFYTDMRLYAAPSGGQLILGRDQQILLCVLHPERFIMESSGEQIVTQSK
jgi:hypothetical protein